LDRESTSCARAPDTRCRYASCTQAVPPYSTRPKKRQIVRLLACVYTLCVQCMYTVYSVYTRSCTSSRILPNLGRFLLAGGMRRNAVFFSKRPLRVIRQFNIRHLRGRLRTNGLTNHLERRKFQNVLLSCFEGEVAAACDGDTVENLSNFRYTQCVYTVHSVYTDSLNFVYSVCTLCKLIVVHRKTFIHRIMIIRASARPLRMHKNFRFHEYGISSFMMSRCILHFLGENTTNTIWHTIVY
jgi:hypothetical protein